MCTYIIGRGSLLDRLMTTAPNSHAGKEKQREERGGEVEGGGEEEQMEEFEMKSSPQFLFTAS